MRVRGRPPLLDTTREGPAPVAEVAVRLTRRADTPVLVALLGATPPCRRPPPSLGGMLESVDPPTPAAPPASDAGRLACGTLRTR